MAFQMTLDVANDWPKEFGIDERKPPSFFVGKDELTPSIAQAHVLRRAFDLLDLDGIFCSENSPLIYFKLMERITPDSVHALHRQFWNHGGAPILVVISSDNVHVYSGMTRPAPKNLTDDELPSLVKTIDRVSTGLKEFLASVESGDFFRQHARSFNPDHRIDRDLLNNLRDTREILDELTQRDIAPHVLDALLCRLVFTCYLFDRKVIGEKYLNDLGLKKASHLRDVLSLQPVKDAKTALYKLFEGLGKDFNGDLFNDDLDAEARQITQKHIQTLSDFFAGTLVRSGQRSFWPYDFGAIPIETISAIYEHFLKATDHQAGAFYTPRFLAEVVLDTALDGFNQLLGKRFLDPACGSGIFLVGLFNRIAEEWKYANPTARNDRRARELMRLLQESLFGVDISPTACRITAFSLYLAYLDQLAPRDIQELQKKGQALPHLVVATSGNKKTSSLPAGNIRCADFFANEQNISKTFDIVVGNPPWGSTATNDTPAGRWCLENKKVLPDKQIATAFVWKAAEHVSTGGRVCFVLPHGVLFNHSKTAIAFQKQWLCQHAFQRVLNLADFRWFLFEKAVHPAIVVSYGKEKPKNGRHRIEYWAPKADWIVTQAEVIAVSPSDRSEITIRELLEDLDGPDAPQTWKQKFWASPRDLRLIDRLSLYPRLRDHVRASRDKGSTKPWIMAEGFQPVGENDDPKKAQLLKLPSKYFIQATSPDLDLFLLPSDCKLLKTASVTVRGRSNKNTEIFRAPHVLITKGFQRIAFSDFDVSFQHALRGIHGPKEQRSLLVFLAAYLRTPLAKYFMFHTSASWGMYRPEGHVEEVLRLPMPFPEQQSNIKRCQAIVKKVAQIVDACATQAGTNFITRSNAIQTADEEIESLVDEYFEIQPLEKILIADTLGVVVPSIQPTQGRMPVPTVKQSLKTQREAYKTLVCDTLNGWADGTRYMVRGETLAASNFGVGMVILEKVQRSDSASPMNEAGNDILESLARLRKIASSKHHTLDPIRGLMIFDRNKLYIVKPIGQRYWTETAALNDADEIAGTILLHASEK
jgi:SAM-dependent methyltransferase